MGGGGTTSKLLWASSGSCVIAHICELKISSVTQIAVYGKGGQLAFHLEREALWELPCKLAACCFLMEIEWFRFYFRQQVGGEFDSSIVNLAHHA